VDKANLLVASSPLPQRLGKESRGKGERRSYRRVLKQY
jgi:hypothetical protein